MMGSSTFRPQGHLQVKLEANGRTRAYWAFWRDENDKKHGRRLGPAHVRDAGRRTAGGARLSRARAENDKKQGRRLGPAHVRDAGRRTAGGAVIWRAGYGEKPSADYLTPEEAGERLEDILAELRASVEDDEPEQGGGTLRQACEGWLAERMEEKGLKRSTIAGYEDMFERLYRDHGAETPVSDFADGRLRAYFADFRAYKVVGEKKAREAKAEGKEVRRVEVTRWTAQPPGSAAVEVKTQDEAVRIASELPGTWKHRRRGC